jgi:hypothetical protein
MKKEPTAFEVPLTTLCMVVVLMVLWILLSEYAEFYNPVSAPEDVCEGLPPVYGSDC